jgi:hypothetical protein
MDNPKIVFAGVDAGAKISVELNRESGEAAAVTATKQNNKAKIAVTLRVLNFMPDCLLVSEDM